MFKLDTTLIKFNSFRKLVVIVINVNLWDKIIIKFPSTEAFTLKYLKVYIVFIRPYCNYKSSFKESNVDMALALVI